MEGDKGKCDEKEVETEKVEEKKEVAGEDDGEDLPDNFFDDFSNQDFMAGLDIVDDWIDEDVDKGENKSIERKPRERLSSWHERSPKHDRYRRYRSRSPRYERGRVMKYARGSPRRRSRSLKRRSRSPRRGSRSPRRRSRSRRSKSPRRRSVSPRQRCRSRSKQGDNQAKDTEESGRRDPEKTKRDIQRDKIRCAKDHEARVFQEQLKVAETGLVPPGMELDIVLQSDIFKNAFSEKKEEKSERKETSERERASNKRRSKRSRSRKDSKPRRYTRSRSRPRISSPKRYRRSCSYKRDYRSRRDSRDIDLRYHLREKRERYKHDLSPISDKKLSRSPNLCDVSPESMISERESWLRSKDRRTRSHYSRSASPISINSLTDRTSSPRRRQKKFSFMKEIEIKLRNTSSQLKPLMSTTLFPPQPPVMNPNQPEFFTGSVMNFQPAPPSIFQPPNIPQAGPGGPQMVPPPDPFQFQTVLQPPNIIEYPLNPPMNFAPQPIPPLIQPLPSPQQIPNPPIIRYDPKNFQQKDENKELTKLFEDKKISLSDFLSVSAKSLDGTSSPEIHNRIKTVLRCQDALKILADPKLMGRFVPKILPATSNEPDAKTSEKTTYQSPMRKMTVVRFNFTTPVNKRPKNTLFSYPNVRVYLYKVLSLLGMGRSEEPLALKEKTPILEIPPAPVPPPIVIVKKESISTQTEPTKCHICEIRKGRKYEDANTQTIEPTTYDISTQVSMDDLVKSPTTFTPRGILKNTTSVPSIAHLTPLQLLAQIQNEKKEPESFQNQKPSWMTPPKKDVFPIATRSFNEQFSPDKPRPLVDDFNRNVNPFSDNYQSENNSGFNRDQMVMGGNRFMMQGPGPGPGPGRPNPFMDNSNMGGMHRFEPNRDIRPQFENPFDTRRFFEQPNPQNRFMVNPMNNKFFNRPN